MGRKPTRLDDDEPIRRCYWSQGWIPIARDDDGNMLLCDLDPRDNGMSGQFISWSVDHGPIGVLASGITPDNAASYGDVDAFLVATGINHPGNFYDIDPDRLNALMAITRNLGAQDG